MNRPTTLIRLSTTDNSAFFDNDIYEDILLKPDSEIALNSLSVESEFTETLNIDNTNNTIQWGISAVNIPVQLTNGSYNQDNILNFEADFNYLFNKSIPAGQIISSRSPYNGLQWQLKLNLNGKTSIKYLRSTTDSVVNNANIVFNNLTVTDADMTITDPTKIGYYYNKIENNKGFGNNYLALRNLVISGTPNQSTTFVYGISINNPSTLVIGMNSVDFGIKVSTSAGGFLNYYFVNGGVETQLLNASGNPILGNTGDFLYHGITEGQIKLLIGRGNNSLTVYDASNNVINMTKDLINFNDMSCWTLFVSENLSSNNRKITNQSVNYDPFLLNQKTTISRSDNSTLNANYPIFNNRGNQTNTLAFQSEDLSSYLGYRQLVYNNGPNYQDPNNKNLYTSQYIAEDKIQFYYIPENLIIEMMNIDLLSYDSSVNKRKSILAILPNHNQDLSVTRQYVYNAEVPKFISIKNNKERLIRNFQLRILDDDLSPLSVKGKCTVSLLIR